MGEAEVREDIPVREQIEALWEQFDYLWKYLGYSEDAILAQRASDSARDNVEKFKHEIREQIVTQFDAASKYQTVIGTVGYAGYFGIWTLTKDILEFWQIAAAGLLGLTSLTIFIVWEIYGMIKRSTATLNLVNLVQSQFLPDEFFSRIELLQNKERLNKVNIVRVWILVSVSAFLTALGGVGILLFAFVRQFTS